MFSAGYRKIAVLLNSSADLLPPLILRLILAYEFWDAGFMKLSSEGWFDQLKFPYPFNLISDDNLWIMSTWLEIAGAIGLLLGLGTRFFTVALMVLTVVAIQTVHWPIEWHTLTDLIDSASK
ncbi:MAG TPA: DoxX family membrane protein [Nitrosomonas sp.]|nr:DoxX family membrane protein [Nitrosomonas sp.]